MHPQNFGGAQSFHRSTVDSQWGFRRVTSPEINNHLLGLVNVQEEVVIPAPLGQLADLLPLVSLIIVGDETHHRLPFLTSSPWAVLERGPISMASFERGSATIPQK